MPDLSSRLADPAYLRFQYADDEKLRDPVETHERYSENKSPVMRWILDRVDARLGQQLLDVGSGPSIHCRQQSAEVPDVTRMLRVEITVPPEYERSVIEDLERRGGRAARSDTMRVIKGEIPSDAVDAAYGADLRSITAGTGTYRAYAPELAK